MDPGRRSLADPAPSAPVPPTDPGRSPTPAAPRATLEWRLRLPGDRELRLGGHARVMGVVNVTPDSFSDGGQNLDPVRAIDHALRLVAEGAALIDLGAESTRPGGGVYGAGAAEVPADEERRRLLPVLRRLRRETSAPISIDTRKAEVARAALDEGADLINDVSCLADPEMAALLRDRSVPVVLMHSRGDLATMQRGIHFVDVVSEVTAELRAALDRAAEAGVDREQTLVDPGLGFGKTAAQNLELLARLDALAELGRPILVGASRKSFVGLLTADAPADRLAGSLAAAAWAARGGAQIVRAHDVAQTVKFLTVWAAIDDAAGAPEARPTFGGPGYAA
jgi:dihydropteroate synthase